MPPLPSSLYIFENSCSSFWVVEQTHLCPLGFPLSPAYSNQPCTWSVIAQGSPWTYAAVGRWFTYNGAERLPQRVGDRRAAWGRWHLWSEHGEKTELGYLAFTETVSPCVPGPLLLNMGIEKGFGVKAPVLPLRKSSHPWRTPGPSFVIQQSSTSSSAKGSALHSILRPLLWMAFHLAANYRLSCNRSPVILFNCRVAWRWRNSDFPSACSVPGL